VPVGGCYLVFMGALAAGLRRHHRGDAGRRPDRLARRFRAGWPAFAAHVIATMAGGYLLLMAVLTGYYLGVSKIGGDFLASAWTGCALLAGLALPVFAAASWLACRRQPGPSRSGTDRE
jgi:hypothetical protein